MEDQVDAGHSMTQALLVANIAYVKFKARVSEVNPHLVLLRFIPTENFDLLDVAVVQKVSGHLGAEGTGATGDQHVSIRVISMGHRVQHR